MGMSYDNSGCSQAKIGEIGLSADDRAQAAVRLEAARSALLGAHESGELGFMNCPEFDISRIREWANSNRSRFTDQVVIGIGGSSLGARAVLESWLAEEAVRTHFSENVDPTTFIRLLDSLDFSKTLFVVITKSGTTIETMSKFWIAWDRALDELGDDRAGRQFVAVTDPEKGALRPLAEEYGLETFGVPPNVGGRFSVLTPVGLLPLAVAGYPVDELLAGAAETRDLAVRTPIAENALLQASWDHYALMSRGITQTVMMAYADQLDGLSEWFAQLWGESLGKSDDRDGNKVHVGLTPIRALGVIDQHSQVQLYMEGPRDKHIVFVETREFDDDVVVPRGDGFPDALSHLVGKSLSEILAAEARGTRSALESAKRPTSRWIFDSIDARNVGAFIMAWEIVTAILGELLNINAFDQPGVELGKKIAHGLLGRDGFDEWASLAELDEGITSLEIR